MRAMESTVHHVSTQYGNGLTADHGIHYETEAVTLRGTLRQVWSGIKSRYKIASDKNNRQRHRSKVIRRQLKDAGLRGLDLIKPEVLAVVSFLRPGERIKAAICGHIENGSSVLLVATETRFLYLDVIPFFTKVEEIGFGIVEAARLTIGQFDATVCLYTGVDTFTLNHVGIDAASKFAEVVGLVVEANQPVVFNQK